MQNKVNFSKLNTDNDNATNAVKEVQNSSSDSAVAWSAIIAGSFIAVAVSFILLFLGSGLGLAATSPWSREGITATTFTIATIAWLVITQFVASGLGGYLTGRLRKRWINTPEDEVFFRDTAHGLLSWALATVVTVALFASAATSIVSGGTKAATTIVAAGAAGATYAAKENSNQAGEMNNYFIDSLFRVDSSNATVTNNEMRTEALRILTLGMMEGNVAENDRTFLA